ncbi:SDR family oxidoreductase [Kaistia geumhonensis]|uniref:NAD(P)-dependent dehydrogenase (Short-subunit alcohol dehydrogenase family) n=1 Tax=Kaistia geumhonensis TaxID=410839 RepID=A0ABU0M9Q4_9HYPH|nr:SDR family oxidoreductase [Kaistia geumhonensis]MCX5480597.1 SDR family oxidoreductase [Kaistia geumhonensis]MDQ0517701.1 NAD(P)-dependent dehydrogenase (short-subunit alcohol dehydrogenase family) [Kaistia geumhonensis]
MTGRLQDKVAIVTGAGRGIGAAIAHAFAREGARVVVAEKDPATGPATAAAITAAGGAAEFLATDVTGAGSVEATAEAVVARHGRIDILVNNAGINVFHKPHETTEAEWRRCFDVDLDGVWRMSKAVLPAMRAAKAGAIVNIASSHSFTIIPGCFPYPVAKHGLLGLTRALGIDYAAEGIRVNAIAPGYIETDLALDYWNTFPDPEAERRRVFDMHPPKRIGRPEEVAMTALFLASDEAPFINAACIVIDGGRSVLYHD